MTCLRYLDTFIISFEKALNGTLLGVVMLLWLRFLNSAYLLEIHTELRKRGVML